MKRLLLTLAALAAGTAPCLAQLPNRPGAAPPAVERQPVPDTPLPAMRPPAAAAPQQEAAQPAIIAIPAAPPPRATAAAPAAAVEGLSFPGFVVRFLARDFAGVPDDVAGRRHVFSMLAGIAQICGERSRSAALAAAGYVDPRVAVNGDMVAGGLQIFMQQLLAMGEAHRTGRVGPMLDAMDPSVNLTLEGREDGALLASRLGCTSREFRDLEARINELVAARSGTPFAPGDDLAFHSLASPDYRERRGIADPAPRMRERRIRESQTKIRAQCVRRYEPAAFCDCLIEGIQSAALEEEQWAAVGADFGTIVEVARARPPVAQAIRTCTRS